MYVIMPHPVCGVGTPKMDLALVQLEVHPLLLLLQVLLLDAPFARLLVRSVARPRTFVSVVESRLTEDASQIIELERDGDAFIYDAFKDFVDKKP